MSAARGSARGALALFACALLVRLLFVAVADTPAAAQGETPWRWGYEAACVATSLLEGRGYADLWGQGTGPTAWLPPAYPLLVAGALALGGGVGPAAAWILFAVQSVLSAATCLVLVALGRAVGVPRVGWWAGWILALHPASVWHAGHTVWDTTLVALCLSLFLLALLPVQKAPPARTGLGLGLGFGALLLVNPAPVSFLPVVAWHLGLGRRSWPALLAFAGGAALVCLPWSLRNHAAVGTYGLRSNLGVEFLVGNNDDATGHFQVHRHPSYDDEELARYVELGEVAYSEEAFGRALAWIRADPLRYVGLSLHRARLYWAGEHPLEDPRTDDGVPAREDPKAWPKWVLHFVGGALGLAGAGLFAVRRRAGRTFCGALLLFPAPYYLTHFTERYRFPVEPLLVFGAAWLVHEAALLRRRRRAP